MQIILEGEKRMKEQQATIKQIREKYVIVWRNIYE